MGANNRLSQGRLFFEDEYDVLTYTIATSGKPPKLIASRIYPGVEERTATARLSRLLSPDSTDVPLKWEKIKAILDETTPEHWMRYMAQIFGYKSPEKDSGLTPEEENRQIKETLRKLKLHHIPDLRRFT
ncbi:MAG TPA: hypothetical protein VMT62_03700 [Syntrophorhabdaceae bacterium]|nr:hypothetical protein [Syntrophorhabdaceae bacterium]